MVLILYIISVCYLTSTLCVSSSILYSLFQKEGLSLRKNLINLKINAFQMHFSNMLQSFKIMSISTIQTESKIKISHCTKTPKTGKKISVTLSMQFYSKLESLIVNFTVQEVPISLFESIKEEVEVALMAIFCKEKTYTPPFEPFITIIGFSNFHA